MDAAIAKVQPLASARTVRGPFDYELSGPLRQTVDVGSLLLVPFGGRQLLGVVVALAQHSEVDAHRLLQPVRELNLSVPADLVALSDWIAAEYCSTVARSLRLVLPPAITRGQRNGRPRALKAQRPTHESVGVLRGRPETLTEDQACVLAQLRSAMRSRAPQQILLHGVTGSGKTEVYLQATSEALASGRGAIVLVPEISLTPQTTSRFIARFGETVAVMHSQLKPSERREEWRRLRTGQARICVGPRSAVFAPIDSLGLIVLDEEHDASYKHEGDPRYDAREVAAMRASTSGALLIAGSATPRPESMHAMSVLRLSSRVDGRSLPPVRVLDMRGHSGRLHPRSVEALAKTRQAQGKAIVLLNRRGWSSFLSCRACGRVWLCPECDVALVLHRAARRLSCHHCGHSAPVPQRCDCGSSTLARHGLGTERLAHDLDAVLGDALRFPVFRLDADTARAGGAEVLSEFERARAGILVGTQMVAKGHDFSDVALGIVLDADATLRFPDFRAEERTFALIAQLAGRVGRGGDGEVLVQTIDPGARAIQHAAAHDSDGFIAGELARRRALRYPPYSHLIRVICGSESAEQASGACAALARQLTSLRQEGTTILGPASLAKLRGRQRSAIVLKASERRRAVQAVERVLLELSRSRAHEGVSFAVDVDPQ